MTLRLSTGLRNSMLGDAFIRGTTLAFVDNGASPDYITDSANGFLNAGFKVADTISVTGATTGGNDITDVALTVVAAGTLTFATGNLAATEDGVAATIVTGSNGESFQELMNDGILHIYSGSQPAVDAAETGTKLLEVTQDSGAFTPGAAGNGLAVAAIVSGTISKHPAETWSGVGLATGTAGWFRFYSNAETTGATVTGIHFDGSVGTSGSDLVLSSTSITLNATTTIDTFSITLPAA